MRFALPNFGSILLWLVPAALAAGPIPDVPFWQDVAVRSRLEPIKRVARSFKAHLDNVLTYFTHRISNAALEGLNNRIAGLVKKAFGYRNRERFKTDILFHLGDLNLYPGQ